MIRISYKGKTTVFEYRGVRKQDAAAKVAEHVAAFGVEGDADGENRRQLDPAGFVALWVEKPGTPEETTEPLPVPGAP